MLASEKHLNWIMLEKLDVLNANPSRIFNSQNISQIQIVKFLLKLHKSTFPSQLVSELENAIKPPSKNDMALTQKR